MTVKELIKKLSEFDQEKEVVFLNNGDNPVTDTAYGIGRIYEIKGIHDEAVFLEEE